MTAAFLSSLRLAFTVQAFVTLQSVTMIGVEGSGSLPRARRELSAAFAFISLISFNIEMLRPGRSRSISASRSSPMHCAGTPALVPCRCLAGSWAHLGSF